MTKIIHCIKVGPTSELGDFELSCVESWKRTYPDFEIRYWTDKELLPYINGCKNAASCYRSGKYAYAMDYVKLAILYEFGGLYMDTDVFAVNRLPDYYFEKAFTAWDPGFDTYWSQNGTCLYCEPGNPVIGDIVNMYKGFEEGKFHDNTVAEFVMRDKGIDWKNRLTCRFTNQDIGNIKVYNCIQFGAWDYVQKCYVINSKLPVYFVHCRTKSWAGYDSENVQIFYAFINKDTDLMKLSYAVDSYINMEVTGKAKPVLLLAVNTLDGNESIFSKRLWMKLGWNGNKQWNIFPLGDGLGEEELNQAFLDYVTKRYNKIKFCRDIMIGDFDGTLHA